MTKTVVALYHDFQTAQQALRALVDEGFARADISLIAQDETYGGQPSRTNFPQGPVEEGHANPESSETKREAAAGAGAGAILGGLAGLVMGLSALAIPGIGPLLAAGPLATALAGVGLGTVTGGVIGALADGGVPEDEAAAYAAGIQRGGTLVAVRAPDDRAGEARDLLYRFGPEDIQNQEGRRDIPASPPTNLEAGMRPAAGAAHRSAGPEGQDPHEHFAGESQGLGFGHGEDTEAGTFGGEFHWPAHAGQGQAGEHQEMHPGSFHAAEEPASGSELERSKHQMEKSTPGMQDQDHSSPGGRGTAAKDWTQGTDMGTGDEGMPMQGRRHDFEGQDDDLYRGIAGSRHPLMADRGGQMGASQAGGRDFGSFLPGYQDHFNMLYADRGRNFDQYEPAYHYGYDLARMERYQGSHWSEIEPQASEEWDRVFPDWPWDEAKDAVRHAWERAAGTQPPAGSDQSGHSRLQGYGAGQDQGYEKPGI